jgi:hypothetical protein
MQLSGFVILLPSATHAACGAVNDENGVHLLHWMFVVEPEGCRDAGRLTVLLSSPPISLLWRFAANPQWLPWPGAGGAVWSLSHRPPTPVG